MKYNNIKQNSSPIIPHLSINAMEMYDRIKEEIKSEIDVCVAAKVMSVYGDYALVQPLPNIRTNSNQFVKRDQIKVRTIGSVTIGDLGYIISGDVPTIDSSGETFTSMPYDPAEGEFHTFSNGFFIGINGGGGDGGNVRFPVYEEAGNDLVLTYSIVGQGYHNTSKIPASVFLPTTIVNTISFKNRIVPFVKTLDLDLSSYGIYIYFAFGYEITENSMNSNYPPNCYCRLTTPYFIITSSTNANYLLGRSKYMDPEINYSIASDSNIGSPNYCSETLKPYHCAINVLTLDFSKYDFSDTSISGLSKIRVINHTDKTPYSMGYFGQNTIYRYIANNIEY